MHQTPYKDTQEKLRFAAILTENFSDAVIGTDTAENNYRILSWNPGAEKLYGWKRDEVLGKTAREVIPSDFTIEQRKKMIESLRENGLWEGEVIQPAKDGRKINIMASVSLVKDENGKEIGAVAVNRDISERIKEQEKLRQSEEKYRQLSETLDEKVKERTEQLAELNKLLKKQVEELKKLSDSDVQKNNFIAMASHELKTPITSIKGYVQLLLNAMEKEKQEDKPLPPLMVKSSLKSVDKQINRLTRLISELLDLSRIETGTLELKKEKFMLNELAIETVEDILYTNTTHEINIYHDVHYEVVADKDRIGQVMINFLTNAIKYSPNSNRVNVKIHQPDENQVAFSVEDFGIGIENDEQQKIFERFYRAGGKAEQTYPGFGMGLFIASEFVQKHGGQMHVKSDKGKGSVFTFTLPLNSNPE